MMKDTIKAGSGLVRDAARKWGHAWVLLSNDQQTAEVCRMIVAVLVGLDDETCAAHPPLKRLQQMAEAALSKVGGQP